MAQFAPKDLAFINLLELELLDQQDNTQLSDALDDLLRVDLMDDPLIGELSAEEKEEVQQNLENAVTQHAEFWRACSPELFIDDNGDEIDLNNECFFGNDHTYYSLMQKQAAELRVAAGMKNASDEVLINILSNNKEECRAYLANRPEFGQLNSLPGWRKDNDLVIGPNVPKAKNTSDNLLTDIAIDTLQMEASKLFLASSIDKCNNIELLNNILHAAQHKHLLAAVKAILPPEAKDISFSFPHMDDEYYENDLSNRIWERRSILIGNAAKIKFEAYIQDLGKPGKPDFLSQKSVLEKNNDDFRDAVCPSLRDEDINEAKGKLGQRYLSTYLSGLKKADLITIMNGADRAQIITAVKNVVGNHDYVTHTLTEANIHLFREFLIHSIINKATSKPDFKALDKIIKADNLEDLKKGMQLLGINQLDSIRQVDINTIKQWATLRMFQTQIANSTQLGADSHPQLLAAFKQLPPQKQIEIMGKETEIHHLLQAKDGDAVRHFLGSDATDSVVKGIVKENENASLFNGIHNGTIAKILVNIKPPVTLDKIKIDAINQSLAKAVDPNIDAKYINMVQEIKTRFPGVNTIAFNKVFGLTEDGSALDGASNVFNDIKKQQLNNEHVRAEYDTVGQPAIKKLVGMILSLEKDEVMSRERIKAIETAFGQADNLQHFIDLSFPILPPLSSNDQKLKIRFINEFTSRVFNQLKTELRKDNLINPNPVQANTSIAKMQEQVEAINAIQRSLNQSKRDQYKPLLDVAPIHLLNPSFQGKIKDSAFNMKKDYQAKAEECSIAIDLLKRNKAILESNLASLPAEDVIHPNKETQAKIHELRKQIKNELVETNTNLSFFTQVQTKVDEIIQQIDNAGTQNYNYIGNGVEIKAFAIGSTLPARITGAGEALSPAPAPTNSSNTTRIESQIGGPLNFMLQDKPQEGMIKVFDVTYKKSPAPQPGSPPGQVDPFGRFTEQHSQLNQANIVTSRNNEVTKVPAGKYEILQFPNAGRNLEQAKVNFAMIMAAQILANLEGPPTEKKPLTLTGENEEEMKYIWTALMVLGEKTPHMKFGADAIRVNSGTFNPKDEQGRFWGYSDNSLYNTVFDKEKKLVDQKTADMADVAKQKFDPEHKNQAEKVMKIKDGLSSLKEQAQKAMKEEGPAPVQSGPSSSI